MLFTVVAVKIIFTGNSKPELVILFHISSNTGYLKPSGPVS